MPAAKKDTYGEYEIKFLELKLKQLEAYIEANPLDELEDRMGTRESKYGPVEYCIANKEAQRKDLTQAMKDYADIAQTVMKMREIEAAKIETRGNAQLGTLAKEFLKGE